MSVTDGELTVNQGDLLWAPTEQTRSQCRLGQYLRWLGERRGLDFPTRNDLWQWSVEDLDGFWSSIWEYFEVIAHTSPTAAIVDRTMPFTEWFPGSRLNYAEHVLRWVDSRADEPAILGYSQTREPVTMTWGQLRCDVARIAAGLRAMGVRPGDRVAGYLPNIPEAVACFLATASIGAVWASCAIEFGARAVTDRFTQIEPAVLIVAGGYGYGTKQIDRTEEVAQISTGLPTVRAVIDLEYGPWRVSGATPLSALEVVDNDEIALEPVEFAHPLMVLFSSGTTGLPKAIVHGHGGVLLEHLKNHALSWDVGEGDRLLWYSTTAWMMWNALISTLLVGASIVTIDGSPVHPDLDWQWRLAEETGATVLGASPGWLMACRKAGLQPGRDHALKVRVLAAAGAPLPPEGYAWVYEQFPGVLLNVGSGGTDVCSGIVQGDPLLPVWAGQISGPALGVAARAFDENGNETIGALGELVITEPMPSMPLRLWGDDDGTLLRETYFSTYPGIWRHGDWIVFETNGSCHVAGRSDATLNRGGVRLGTAEFYRVVEEIDGIADSLVVHLDRAGGNGRLLLFVVPEAGRDLDEDLRSQLVGGLRSNLSPRHVPDEILQMPFVPRNLTGKKLELPVKRILQGADLDSVASRDALARPDALDPYVAFARTDAAGPS
ncbi:MAG: acetoacetate--CoA ligase [Actinomycetales bacterium]